MGPARPGTPTTDEPPFPGIDPLDQSLHGDGGMWALLVALAGGVIAGVAIALLRLFRKRAAAQG